MILKLIFTLWWSRETLGSLTATKFGTFTLIIPTIPKLYAPPPRLLVQLQSYVASLTRLNFHPERMLRNVTKYGSPGNCSRQISGYIYVIAVPPGLFQVKNCIIGAINKLGGERAKKPKKKKWYGNAEEALKIVAQVAIHGLPLADTPCTGRRGTQYNILETM